MFTVKSNMKFTDSNYSVTYEKGNIIIDYIKYNGNVRINKNGNTLKFGDGKYKSELEKTFESVFLLKQEEYELKSKKYQTKPIWKSLVSLNEFDIGNPNKVFNEFFRNVEESENDKKIDEVQNLKDQLESCSDFLKVSFTKHEQERSEYLDIIEDSKKNKKINETIVKQVLEYFINELNLNEAYNEKKILETNDLLDSMCIDGKCPMYYEEMKEFVEQLSLFKHRIKSFYDNQVELKGYIKSVMEKLVTSITAGMEYSSEVQSITDKTRSEKYSHGALLDEIESILNVFGKKIKDEHEYDSDLLESIEFDLYIMNYEEDYDEFMNVAASVTGKLRTALEKEDDVLRVMFLVNKLKIMLVYTVKKIKSIEREKITSNANDVVTVGNILTSKLHKSANDYELADSLLYEDYENDEYENDYLDMEQKVSHVLKHIFSLLDNSIYEDTSNKNRELHDFYNNNNYEYQKNLNKINEKNILLKSMYGEINKEINDVDSDYLNIEHNIDILDEEWKQNYLKEFYEYESLKEERDMYLKSMEDKTNELVYEIFENGDKYDRIICDYKSKWLQSTNILEELFSKVCNISEKILSMLF